MIHCLLTVFLLYLTDVKMFYKIFPEHSGYITQVYRHGGSDGKVAHEQEESNITEDMET